MIANGVEDEDKWLAAGITGLQQNAFHVNRALESNNLKDALKYSSQMLSELRTSKLSPHKYYELYMRAFDELRKLEMFFKEEARRGCSVVDLYELVQHAGNILPRLYLLCTAGSVYIQSKEAPAKDILKDLVEMCRGVQHPLRGLFLRSYLSQVSKDKLLDVEHDGESDADTVSCAVEFVLQNFTEMNKLWVRMQHQGPAREKEKREKERSELRDLVGKNLHVLSQIDGIDLEIYKETVLPRILEQIVNCKDELAQLYLMDCVIQVFPDEYHLQSLGILLGVCPQIQPNVDIKSVLSGLMERLSQYASGAGVLSEFIQVDAFSKLNHAIGKVIETQSDMPVIGIVTLYSSLLKFTLHVHPDRLDYADQVLGAFAKKLPEGRTMDRSAAKEVVALLTTPLEKFNNIVTTLKLTNYPHIMEFLDIESSKIIANLIVQSIMKNHTIIPTAEKVDALFGLIKSLIKEINHTPTQFDEDFEEEQNSVARVIQMLSNDNPEEMYKIICTVKKHILTGGPKRLPFTVPSLVFSSLKLVRTLQCSDENPFGNDASTSPKKLFQLLSEVIDALSAAPAPELSIRLHLQCAEAANICELELAACEFFTQAYILYEDEVSDSRAQVTAMNLIIGTLQRMHVFGVENRETLTHKATGYSAKLLKKTDQCRAVYNCAHLFWADGDDTIKDGERVLVCLKRALRIANTAQQMASVARGGNGSVTLFIEILNKYLYFFEKGVKQITVSAIQSLIELITTEMQSDTGVTDQAAGSFFASTLKHIQFKKEQAESSDRYAAVKV